MDPKTQHQPLIERKYEQYFTPQKTTNNNDSDSLQQPLQGEVVDSVTTYGVYEPPIVFDK
jgi:hypothetical protein